MIVVADGSPIVVLVNIDAVDVLPGLFETVLIPPEIAAELHSQNRPLRVRQFMESPPAWLIEKAPIRLLELEGLHAGEIAAISLAIESKADLLLIDEAKGRKAATENRLRITGTIGILEAAADRQLVDLAEAFSRIKQTDFWISHRLLDQRLALHKKRKA